MACSGADDGSVDPLDEMLPLEGEAGGNMPSGMEPSAEPEPNGASGPMMMIDEGAPDLGGLAPGEEDAEGGADEAGDGDDDGQEPAPMDTEANEMLADVAATELCELVADWDPEWVQFEEEVLLLVNENRARGADCDTEGTFEPAPPLSMDPTLRCTARLHSLDMFERDFFDHVNPDGEDPFARMAEAGFQGSAMGENIAVGQVTPEQVMQSWMDSDGHCANVMLDAFTVIGIGFHPGAGQRGLGSNFWTQNFGTPRPNLGGGGGRGFGR